MQNSVTQFTQMFPPLIPQLHDVDIDSPGNWLLPIHAKSLDDASSRSLLPIIFLGVSFAIKTRWTQR